MLNGQLQPPELWHLLLANGLALGLTLLLDDLAMRPPDQRWVPLGTVDIPGATSLDKLRPSALYIRVADVGADHILNARDRWRRGVSVGEWETSVVLGLDVIAIQLIYFGGPMVLAESIGFPPGLAVGIGTVLKILPARYSELPIRLVLGTSFAWLWLTGGWWLALGSYMGLFLGLNLLGRIVEGPRKRTGRGERNRRNELPD